MKPGILLLSHYWVVFALCAGAGWSNAFHRKEYCLTDLPRLLKHPFFCPSFNNMTGDSPPNHYSSGMVTTLNPWNETFCVFGSFCVDVVILIIKTSLTVKLFSSAERIHSFPLIAYHKCGRLHLLSHFCFKRLVMRMTGWPTVGFHMEII